MGGSILNWRIIEKVFWRVTNVRWKWVHIVGLFHSKHFIWIANRQNSLKMFWSFFWVWINHLRCPFCTNTCHKKYVINGFSHWYFFEYFLRWNYIFYPTLCFYYWLLIRNELLWASECRWKRGKLWLDCGECATVLIIWIDIKIT